MGLQGSEVILIGFDTPIHNPPFPEHDRLSWHHNSTVMRAGAYQNASFVVGVAKAAVEEGVRLWAAARSSRPPARPSPSPPGPKAGRSGPRFGAFSGCSGPDLGGRPGIFQGVRQIREWEDRRETGDG